MTYLDRVNARHQRDLEAAQARLALVEEQQRAEYIAAKIITRAKVSPGYFYEHRRRVDQVALRCHVMHELNRQLNWGCLRISQFLGLTHTTVLYHLKDHCRHWKPKGGVNGLHDAD